MTELNREESGHYEFGSGMEPALRVEPGESFTVEVWDSFKDQLFDHGMGEFDASDVPTMNAPPPGFDANPVSGPVYVEGVDPGDTLAVHVEEIVPERGYTTTLEGHGNLAGKEGWDSCKTNYAHEVTLEPGPSGTTADGTARMELGGREWEWELNPHIGTIATAPGRTVQDPLTTQGPWGGNMDVRDLQQGSTVCLTSFTEGGQLFLGDVHASQSDSEYTGFAVETRATVTLRVEVVDHDVPGVFRIETEDSIIHVDSSKNAGTPAAALDGCFEAMMAELIEEHGFSEREAYIQMSVNPNVTVRTYQFIRPDYFTVGVKLDTAMLDGVSG
ncbi:Acetamidase/formamidase [Haloplanus vescus]|uniref:Acetamidase/formamidase n=1 Tax=Haloplanus vescus TaxID=555874 RepID=A0A1H3WDV5_9EURY|nr:acetamidase/formamidase family protein [Haloplanus vescus]SDZ84428.1 Acetamidase/formamidase [Haloplanus vescus]